MSASGTYIYFNLPVVYGWYPVFCSFVGSTSHPVITVSQPIVNPDNYTCYTRIHAPMGDTTVKGKFIVGYVKKAS